MLTKFKADYPVVVELRVAWGDMDALGHVNNTKFFNYFESARISYFEKTKILEDMAAFSVVPVLAKTSCKFIKPLYYPDTILVGARVSQLETDRFFMRYGIYSLERDHIAALGEGVLVSFDYKQKIKADLPKKWIKEISSIEEELNSSN